MAGYRSCDFKGKHLFSTDDAARKPEAPSFGRGQRWDFKKNKGNINSDRK